MELAVRYGKVEINYNIACHYLCKLLTTRFFYKKIIFFAWTSIFLT